MLYEKQRSKSENFQLTKKLQLGLTETVQTAVTRLVAFRGVFTFVYRTIVHHLLWMLRQKKLEIFPFH